MARLCSDEDDQQCTARHESSRTYGEKRGLACRSDERVWKGKRETEEGQRSASAAFLQAQRPSIASLTGEKLGELGENFGELGEKLGLDCRRKGKVSFDSAKVVERSLRLTGLNDGLAGEKLIIGDVGE